MTIEPEWLKRSENYDSVCSFISTHGDIFFKCVCSGCFLSTEGPQIQFTPKAETSAFFVKKSALLASGSDFRFDFAVAADLNQLDLNQDQVTVHDQNCADSSRRPEPTAIAPSDNSFRFNFNVETD